MEGKNVFVVVDVNGAAWPYIADSIDDAIAQHGESNFEEIAGVFVYGNDYVGYNDEEKVCLN